MKTLGHAIFVTVASIIGGLALLAGFLWSARYWLWSGPIQ